MIDHCLGDVPFKNILTASQVQPLLCLSAQSNFFSFLICILHNHPLPCSTSNIQIEDQLGRFLSQARMVSPRIVSAAAYAYIVDANMPFAPIAAQPDL